MTASSAKVIAIDEPNSFLHPGAARKLVELLHGFSQHQYIVSTHSPEVIKAANAKSIVKIELRDGESVATSIDARELDSMNSLLREIGSQVSDVMAADNLIWVEGPSEASVFPSIILRLSGKRLFGTEFVALLDTGRVEKGLLKDGEILGLYEQLSTGAGLVPRAIAFCFDREKRTESVVLEIQRRHKHIYFLPRRMLENYLLHPEAIVATIRATLSPLVSSSEIQNITGEAVSKWMDANGRNKIYFNLPSGESIPELFSPSWLSHIHAAEFLKALFSDVTEAKLEYSKTRDDPLIVEWLLENKPEFLDELRGYLDYVVSSCGATVVQASTATH